MSGTPCAPPVESERRGGLRAYHVREFDGTSARESQC